MHGPEKTFPEKLSVSLTLKTQMQCLRFSALVPTTNTQEQTEEMMHAKSTKITAVSTIPRFTPPRRKRT
jgi:hypothetical protein